MTWGSWVEKMKVVPVARLRCSITSSSADRGGRVQIRRRFIRQDKRGFGNHGASHGNPLLLAAGQFRRATIFKSGEADFRKQLFHPLPALMRRHSLKQQRKLGVLQRGKNRQQVVGLEHKADAMQTQKSQLARR